VTISCWRCGTTYRSDLQVSINPRRFFLEAEAWHHA
jgi:hypothetical protein